MFDIVVIGGGVIGTSIARELSKYKVSICLVERGPDVAMGASKANSGIIHAGFDPEPGTLIARTNIQANMLYEKLCEELDVRLKKNGRLVIAFDEKEREALHELYDRGKKNGAWGLHLVDSNEIKKMEPAVNENVVGGLYAPNSAIVCPYELTIALAENAVMNGVKIMLNTEVTGISKDSKGMFKVEVLDLGGDKERKGIEKKGRIECRYVINAAGLSAGKISACAGAEEYEIKGRKGEYFLLDKYAGKTVRHTIFGVPGKMGKGVLVAPTIDGNLLVGPNAKDVEDDDVSTTLEGLEEVWSAGTRLVPSLDRKATITTFSGIRAIPPERDGKRDFIVEMSNKLRGFVNVAGICSPGLSGAPAIAKMVVRIIEEDGFKLVCKGSDFISVRKGIPRFRELSNEERMDLIRKDSRFGRVVCRCETVTEGEIVEALHRPFVSGTIDGIKRRVRAGMGRCQGGFCGPRVVSIISR
ncbi:MAG: NAD(P)/FAD-dependent oxidoreductase, partial [Thermoplasmata archaeon]